MDKSLEIKLKNVLKHEAKYIMTYEENTDLKLDKMNTIFNLEKIIENYDELEPLLTKFFINKAEKIKWKEK